MVNIFLLETKRHMIQILLYTILKLNKQSTLMRVAFITVALLLATSIALQCDGPLDLRVDCGYVGINQQQCEAKGCCWKPTNFFKNLVKDVKQEQNGAPWCFYSQGQSPCANISFKGEGGMGFDTAFYNKMYAFFEANIDIKGKGGVVAAPDTSTPGGSYYYHWMRDAALTMRTFMQVNNFNLSKVEAKMKTYVSWVTKVQGQKDPQGFDVRINPKFELPNGEVFVGGWCRPQTDGPGLRAGALLLFADLLLKNSQSSYVSSSLIGPIKFDLDWVMANWKSEGCDLWQEVRSNDFYWGRAAYVYSLGICESVFSKLGDSSYASKCTSTKNAVKATLEAHWTGSFMKESSNREKDGSVVHAFSSFHTHLMTDEKVAKTMQVLALTFCSEYAINQAAVKSGLPGILIGRYPGDSYAGGNPWQLLTAVYGKAFYQGANVLMKSNGFLKESDRQAWFELLKLPQSASFSQQVQAMIKAGDAVMSRLYSHVKDDGGHIAEQIDRNNGKQKSAKDLTWSYANILSAMREREKAAVGLQQLMAQKVQ